MSNRIFTEDLFPDKHQDEVVELLYDKKKKKYLNAGLMLVYISLLFVSIFII